MISAVPEEVTMPLSYNTAAYDTYMPRVAAIHKPYHGLRCLIPVIGIIRRFHERFQQCGHSLSRPVWGSNLP